MSLLFLIEFSLMLDLYIYILKYNYIPLISDNYLILNFF